MTIGVGIDFYQLFKRDIPSHPNLMNSFSFSCFEKKNKSKHAPTLDFHNSSEAAMFLTGICLHFDYIYWNRIRYYFITESRHRGTDSMKACRIARIPIGSSTRIMVLLGKIWNLSFKSGSSKSHNGMQKHSGGLDLNVHNQMPQIISSP